MAASEGVLSGEETCGALVGDAGRSWVGWRWPPPELQQRFDGQELQLMKGEGKKAGV